MAVQFTDAQKIYWMHVCPSFHIIRIHALHGANSWSVKKIFMLFSQSDWRDSKTHFNMVFVCMYMYVCVVL